MKVIGGIKGIANSEVTLNEYFLTAAEMGNIVNNFCKTFGIDENQSRKRDEHHQLTGSKKARIETNCTKVSHVFSEHDATFEGEDSVYKIFTKKVLPSDVADHFLKAKEIGQTKYEEFVKEKHEVEGSIWDTIKKEKIATFVSNNKGFTVIINNETYQIKEERKLLNRFLVVSRKRPDLDLPIELGKYEFFVTPPSMFASDGTLNHEKKKMT